MTRRRRDPAAHLRGNILDPLPGQEHLEGLTLLERASLTPRCSVSAGCSVANEV